LTKKRFKAKAKRLYLLKTPEATRAAKAFDKAIQVLQADVCASAGAVGMFALFKPKQIRGK
jgi:hypothetical protein